MPRVSINKKKYLQIDLREWMVGRMRTLGLTYQDMAELLGISSPAFSKRINAGNFKNTQLYEIFNKLEATDEEILKLMKL